MQGPGRLSKKGVLWPPPPGRREPALWPISALVQELWRATGNLQTWLWSPRFFKWLSMSWSRMLKVFYRVQSSSAAKAGVLRACRSVCNCLWVPLGTNWNQKGEKSKPGTLPDAHAGAGKTITAIIFKCFLSARPVPSAFHGLPHSLLQQPHGAGTVTLLHRWADKAPTLYPDTARTPARPSDSAYQKASLSINSKGLSWSLVFNGQGWNKMWCDHCHRGDHIVEMLLRKVMEVLNKCSRPALLNKKYHASHNQEPFT